MPGVLPINMELEDFTNTVLPHKNKLFRFALKMVGDVAEAEDIVQEVFMKLWKQREKLHVYNNLEAWCMTLTKNQAIDKLRSRHRQTDNIDHQYHLTANEAGPDRLTESNDLLEYVHSFIQALPERQAAVLQLRDVEGLSYKEIAEALDISLDLVKVNLFRARRQIRQQLINTESYGL